MLRFQNDHGLSAYDAGLLVEDRAVAEFFEAVTQQCQDPKLAANWVMGDLLAYLNKADLSMSQSPVDASALGHLIARIIDQTISGKIAKQVFEVMCGSGGHC